METNMQTELKEMKYSEFLQTVIDLIPEYYNWLMGSDNPLDWTKNSVYLCNHLDYIADHKPDISKAYIKKLRDTIKRKLNGDSTLGRKIGFSTEARIRWLESLILIYKAKGK